MVIDLTHVTLKDCFALVALNSLIVRYKEMGKTLAVQTLAANNGTIVELFGAHLSGVELAFSDPPSKGVALATV